MSAATMTMKLQHSQGLLSSTVKIEEDTVLTQKQGIVTILGCHRDTNTASAAASSLRRTLSADMSSKKWLTHPLPQNGSSEQLLHPKTIADSSSSSEGEDDDDYEETKELDAEAERERLEIWASIQRNKKEEQEKAGSFDTWSSLMSLKTKDEISKSLPATPYIHPLVKTKSSLSEKSLEICTESLGSETGSDGLVSSYPPSETGDAEEEEEEEEEEQHEEEKVKEPEEQEEEEEVLRYNYGTAATTKKSPPRSFPPPLPSLSRQTGPSLHMRPHRDNGRLVLEAVSLPSQNNFCVQRQDGRLVLTFANQEDAEKEDEKAKENDGAEVEELEEEFDAFEEEKEGEDEDEDEDGESESESDVRDVESVIEKAPLLSGGITASVNGLASKVNKPIGSVNRNPKWSEKFNEEVNFEDVDVVEATQMVQSLPPRPRVARLIPSAAAPPAAAASFNLNAYEHYWRTKPTAKDAVAKPLAHYQGNYNDSALKMKKNSSKIIVSNEKQQVLVLRGKNGDYLVHNLKSCKDSRRSFLFWEPYCIATS